MRWLDGITDSTDWVWASSRSCWWKLREAWRAAVHGVTKSRTWLSDRTELKILNTDNTKGWWGYRTTELSLIAMLNCSNRMQNCTATLKDNLAFSYVTYSYHTFQQLHSNIFTEGSWKHVHSETCTQLFTATLFIFTKMWRYNQNVLR